MSIARRVTVRRLLGTGAATLALCASGASAAWATGPGGDGWNHGGTYKPGTGAGTETGTDRCQFSLDGVSFFDSVKVDDQNLKPTEDGKVHIKVRAAQDAATCTASLASYIAHGPTFATSGEQIFVDFDTVTVKQGQTDSLDIAVPDAGCYAQIDLYRGATKFDGNLDANDGFTHGELPKGPDRPVIKDKLIAAWNGGTKDCSTTQTTPPATPPAESTPRRPNRPRRPPSRLPGLRVHASGLRDPVDGHPDPVRLGVHHGPRGHPERRRRPRRDRRLQRDRPDRHRRGRPAGRRRGHRPGDPPSQGDARVVCTTP